MATLAEAKGGRRVGTLELVKRTLEAVKNGETTVDVANDLYGDESKAGYVAATLKKVAEEFPKFKSQLLAIEHPKGAGRKKSVTESAMAELIAAYAGE